ncbi:MAG TPA: hypothetical protein VGS22_14685 [Thermoanaerobaculia bacterium]|jgi:hypothetical protein|nr:hypothetical protein [Thermoanaerobaculia bacterium]
MLRLARLFFLVLALVALGSASGCYKQSDFEPPAVVEESLTLGVVGSTSIPADGVSRLRLVAQIDPRADLNKRTVIFSATAGTLVGGNPSAQTGEREVAADATGQATIELQSAQQVGSAVVVARVKEVPGLSRSVAVGFIPADVNGVIRFVQSPGSAPADGASKSVFTVEVSSALPLGTQVTFATSGGLFAPENAATATRSIDGSFRATVELVSPGAIGTGIVTATANQVTRQTQISFVRALPDLILVSTGGKVTAKAGLDDPVTVTASFQRNIGQVTPGTAAVFTATDSSGREIGIFRDLSTVNASGSASATFLAGTTTFRGPVTIAVSVQGGTVRGFATIQIIDP